MDTTPETASELLHLLNPPLWIVTARHENLQGGLLATFVSSASIVPDYPRMLIGIAKQHRTHALIAGSGSFALHVVPDSYAELAETFGLHSSRDIDKFDRREIRTAVTQSPILSELSNWLDCSVEESVDIGDRTLFLGKVVAAACEPNVSPLTVQSWIEMLDSEQKAMLQKNLQHDSVVDRERIVTWLAQKSISCDV